MDPAYLTGVGVVVAALTTTVGVLWVAVAKKDKEKAESERAHRRTLEGEADRQRRTLDTISEMREVLSGLKTTMDAQTATMNTMIDLVKRLTESDR